MGLRSSTPGLLIGIFGEQDARGGKKDIEFLNRCLAPLTDQQMLFVLLEFRRREPLQHIRFGQFLNVALARTSA